MPPYRWTHSRSLSVALIVLGGPLIPAGLLTTVSALGAGLPDGAAPGRGAVVLLGLAMMLVGFVFVLARKGVIVDGDARTVTFWWGLGVPLRKICSNIGAYTRVGVSAEERRSKAEHGPEYYTVHVVSLLGPDEQVEALLAGSGNPIAVYEARSLARAMTAANEISAALGLPIEEPRTE